MVYCYDGIVAARWDRGTKREVLVRLVTEGS
jgi:hypothetical protein